MASISKNGVKTTEFFMSVLGKGGPLAGIATIESTDPWYVVLGKVALSALPEIGSWVYTKHRTDLKKITAKLDLP